MFVSIFASHSIVF